MNLGENTHANSHTIPDTVFIMRIELFLSTMSSWIIMFVRDVNVPNVSLSLSAPNRR